MHNPHFFQKYCHFRWLCFDFSENDNTFERNEDCTILISFKIVVFFIIPSAIFWLCFDFSWKWPQLWKKWGSRNRLLKMNGLYLFWLKLSNSTSYICIYIFEIMQKYDSFELGYQCYQFAMWITKQIFYEKSQICYADE